MNVQGRTQIRPQEGPQWQFCASRARITIYGGAAGGGKSYGLLLNAARHIKDPTYNAIIFRRKYTEIVLPGALWDTSRQIYNQIGGTPIRGRTEWVWDGGGKVKFSHLNEEKNAYDHQGGQYAFIGFDELTEFTWFQFSYLMTRNRPPDGCMLEPRMVGTCNPDADSWVADFIQWWWDPETGYPIPERSGVVRYFHIVDDKPEWVEESWRDEEGNKPISVTFIASSLEDNPILMIKDPTYKANIAGKDFVTRERLLKGNWRVSYSGGMFDPEWFEIIEPDQVPKGIRQVRYWDFAASEVKEKDKNDPDWTAGAKCAVFQGVLYIIDVDAFREKPGKSEKLIKSKAVSDGHEIEVWWEEEKGSAGKWTSTYLYKVFEGFEAHADPVSGQKVERAKPWAAWAEFGRVKLVKGDWNRRFLGRVGKFPNGKRDEIDAVSGAFKALVGPQKVFPYYIPNELGHLREFPKELKDFQKVQTQNIEVYVSLWAEKSGGVYGGCYVWSLVNKRLRLYNETFMPQPTAPELAHEIIDKLVVDIESKSGFVTLTKIVGNDEFFNLKEKSLAKELKKWGIRVRPNTVYDETSAILRANHMFIQNQIILHTECQESDIQYRGWMREEEKEKLPKPGFPLARALCLLVSELKAGGKLTIPQLPNPYTQKKQKIRETLKSSGLSEATRNIERCYKQYEYLVQ